MQNKSTARRHEWTIIKLLNWAISYFKSHDIEGPRTSAELLLAHVLGVKRIDLYLRYDQPLLSDELSRFKALIKRRIDREPVAYIVGKKGFWSIDLAVSDDVLIPRPETECLVEVAQKTLSNESALPRKRILELGTGSGAVILALASQHPDHFYFATDVSPNAIGIARLNSRRLGLQENIRFFCGNWLSPLRPESDYFDMILSNPPYIKSADIDKLQPEIHIYEPAIALDGGDDGLCCLRRIINLAFRYLKPRGVLMLEIGHDQKEDVHAIMRECDRYDNFFCTQDYQGHDRVIRVTKKLLRTDI
ncbi:MAG: peptide chain release factor N(5)-glutamine methyltransferase [Planctomycetota bacterium]|jgi:release factor glutamine methyltransferase